VVFSDKTMDGFRAQAPEVVEQIERAFRHWDDIDTYFKGEKITSSGHGFCGIARKKLLQVLQARALELGVTIYETDITDPDVYAKQYDLVIGADGVHSVTRKKHEAHFNPRIAVGDCRFIWLGTKKKLDAFTFAFRQTQHGWFNLHAYRFDDEWSTFIVETPEHVARRRPRRDDPEQSIALCEELFADLLDGHRLISNARHLRGSAVWLRSTGCCASAGTRTTSSCSATPPTPRTSRSARAPSWRWRTRSRWPRCCNPPTATCRPGSAATRPSARSRRSSCRARRATG
jgi:anthraniloyl-CoA monooxygenase